MTVTCIDCNKPRCLYASRKITDEKREILVVYLDTICYTCGVSFYTYRNRIESEGDSLGETSQKRNMEALEDDNVLSDVEPEEEEENPIIEDDDADTNTKRNDINQEL